MARKGIMKSTLETMLRDLKAVYTDTWFLPADKFAASVDAWHRALGSHSYDELKGAFDEYIKTHDRPPAPSQIRELILSTQDGEARTPQFSEADYWSQHRYWVLEDLNGYHLNDFIVSAAEGADDIAAWLTSKGYDLTGTVLKPADYKPYRPRRLSFGAGSY